jgi:hypothetical protein
LIKEFHMSNILCEKIAMSDAKRLDLIQRRVDKSKLTNRLRSWGLTGAGLGALGGLVTSEPFHYAPEGALLKLPAHLKPTYLSYAGHLTGKTLKGGLIGLTVGASLGALRRKGHLRALEEKDNFIHRKKASTNNAPYSAVRQAFKTLQPRDRQDALIEGRGKNVADARLKKMLWAGAGTSALAHVMGSSLIPIVTNRQGYTQPQLDTFVSRMRRNTRIGSLGLLGLAGLVGVVDAGLSNLRAKRRQKEKKDELYDKTITDVQKLKSIEKSDLDYLAKGVTTPNELRTVGLLKTLGMGGYLAQKKVLPRKAALIGSSLAATIPAINIARSLKARRDRKDKMQYLTDYKIPKRTRFF